MKKRTKAILLLCLVTAGAVGSATGDMIRSQVRVRTKTSKSRSRSDTILDNNNWLVWDE